MKISQAVNYLINRKPFIAEALKDNIINYAALADHLKPEIEYLIGKPIKEGAIIMALRRYESVSDPLFTKKLDGLIKKIGDIIVRSNLVDYTFRNSESLIKRQQNLLKFIHEQKDFFYTISQGIYETTFILSESIRNDIPVIFEGEKLISNSANLSAITLKLPTENIKQPGLYYFIFRKLAWEGINILEVVSTSNEFTILLDDNDIDKAFMVIKRLKK